MLGSSESYK